MLPIYAGHIDTRRVSCRRRLHALRDDQNLPAEKLAAATAATRSAI